MLGVIAYALLGAYGGWLLIHFLYKKGQVKNWPEQFVVLGQYGFLFFLVYLASLAGRQDVSLRIIEFFVFICSLFLSAIFTTKNKEKQK